MIAEDDFSLQAGAALLGIAERLRASAAASSVAAIDAATDEDPAVATAHQAAAAALLHAAEALDIFHFEWMAALGRLQVTP